MGGQVATGGQTQNQTQNQNQLSTTTPWAPAGSAIGGLLGQLGGINSGPSGIESSALDTLSAIGAQGNQFSSGIGNAANSLLAGGGALNQSGLVNNAYSQYQKQLNPYLQSSFLDPRNTPGFGDALSALNSDITGQINGQFAGAGRDLSGMNTQTLARGLSQGEGQLIANQYNQNVGNQLGAAGSLYNAGNATGGLLSQFQQNYNANQQAGIGAANAAKAAETWGPMLQLQAEAQRRGIPLQTLAAEMGIALPAGQAFGTTNAIGTGTMQGQTEKTSPLWQQLVGGAIGGAGILGGTGAFGKSGWLNFGGA